MSSTYARATPFRSREALPELEFVNWPLRDEPITAWPLLALAIGAAAFTGLVSQSIFTGFLAAAALLVCLWRLLLPITYQLSARGLYQTVLGRRRRIPWSQFRELEVGDRGVLLVPRGADSQLSRLRGLYLRFGDRRDELLSCLQSFLSPRAADGATG